MADRFDALHAFVKVADLQGFAPAARALGISASVVTRLVAALEAKLGVRLLQRTTRTVALTDPGARYLERARRILADLEEADSSVEADRTQPVGQLVVAAPLMFGRLHVAPLICDYLALYPDVTADLTLADRMVHLVEEGIDVAVRLGHLADSSLIARKVGETRRVIVASPAYLKRHGTPRDPRELKAHATIRFSGLTASTDWRFRRNGKDENVSLTPRYTTNSADAAIGLALRDGGLTCVLAYQAADAIKAKALKIVLAEFGPPPLPIQLVYPTSRLLSAKVRAFVDLAEKTRDWDFA
ncbi:MAG: LysR family transcriptional regulator [Alphaproteobacteria bacterium]|nr:LysR family transcriptional regulator [Alphaproteobacteria bacterium]